MTVVSTDMTLGSFMYLCDPFASKWNGYACPTAAKAMAGWNACMFVWHLRVS